MEKIKTIRKFVLESIYICCYAYECDFMDLCDEKPELKMMNFSLGRKIIFFFSLSKYTQMKHICNIQTEKKTISLATWTRSVFFVYKTATRFSALYTDYNSFTQQHAAICINALYLRIRNAVKSIKSVPIRQLTYYRFVFIHVFFSLVSFINEQLKICLQFTVKL